ncbi:MAG TPA: CDP-alcohol phosphatidyltransferase family protein [Terracidiphilus sp.]|nr:CDP-alcohol phosphatidyltransferase family protein [Terracidiphilus sp.]
MSVPIASNAETRSFQHAQRINGSFTAAAEKRVLLWLAEHAPRWLTSDQLTVLGLCAQIAAGASFALAHFHRAFLLAVIPCLALNWLGDSLDGTLARVRCQQRPRYGFYVDHIVDLFGAFALMLGMGASGFLHWSMALAMLLAFLLLSAESYLATYTLARFHLSQGLFGPTEIRVLLAVGCLALLRSPYSTLVGHHFLLFDACGLIATICMFAMAVITALRHIVELYHREPLPEMQEPLP